MTREQVSYISSARKLLLNSTAAAGIGLALVGCAKPANGSELQSSPVQETSSAVQPKLPDPVYDKSLEDPAVCIGTTGVEPFVAPGQFSAAQNGQKEIVLCDLSGSGLLQQLPTVEATLQEKDCRLDTSRQARYFKYPTEEPIVTLALPVQNSSCIGPII